MTRTRSALVVGSAAAVAAVTLRRSGVDTVQLLFEPLTRQAARKAITGRDRSQGQPDQGRFTRREVGGLLEQAWATYRKLAPELPAEPSAGGRMNMKLACLTVSFLRALLAAGVERGYAVELIADTTWAVYEKWGQLNLLLIRFLPAPLWRRLQAGGGLVSRRFADGTISLAFPFSPPSYLARAIPTQDAIAFDMLRCPVAGYFRANNAVDLCRRAWCDLDYPLGEMRNLRLVRTKTLVEGDDCCDFRFLAQPSGEAT